MMIEKRAADINGYTPAIWEEVGAVSLKEARLLFAKQTKGYRGICWGHNVTTEERWLGRHFPEFAGRITGWRCTMQELRKYCKAKGIKTEKGTLTLANACKLAGYMHRGAHGALEDCIATVAVMRWLREHSLAC